jgi:hypothetical protein
MTPYPHSLFSDEEQQRLVRWNQKRGQKESTSHHLKKKHLSDIEMVKKKTIVIDPAGRWMAQWDTQFEQFGIETLRSPVSFHPDPYVHY